MFRGRILRPRFALYGFCVGGQTVRMTPEGIARDAQVIDASGFIDPSTPPKLGLHTVYLVAPNNSWIPLLQKMVSLNTTWNIFTGLVVGAYNALTTEPVKLIFPKNQTVNGKFYPRKGYDPKRRAFWFLIESKPKTTPHGDYPGGVNYPPKPTTGGGR